MQPALVKSTGVDAHVDSAVLLLLQESLVQPGWVKVRHTADGCSLAWHTNAHPLSYPMAVTAPDSYPPDPVGELRAGAFL
jgi:hypothetical protein